MTRTSSVRRREGRRAASTGAQLAVLKNQRVWRFALYYLFVFGAFVALALWLRRCLVVVARLAQGAKLEGIALEPTDDWGNR